MQYTEVELNEIRKKVEKLEERLSKLDKFEEESLRERMLLGREINELTALLSAEPVEEKNDDIIGLGSRFRLTLNSEEFGTETDDYIMTYTNIKVPGFITITYKSPLGFAVFGKEVGESFEYDVNGFAINGVIDKIYKAKQEEPKQKTIEK